MVDEVSKSYVTALVSLLEEQKSKLSLNECLDQLQLVKNIISDDSINKFLNHPNIELSEKLNIINSALKDFNPLIVSFINVLIESKVINSIDSIINALTSYIDDLNGVCRVEIITSKVLEESTYNKIIKCLENKFSKKIIAKQTVESNILGGIIIKKDGVVIDNSIINKLDDLVDSILNNR